MLTTANEVPESKELLVVDAGPGWRKTKLAKDLERCDREMAAAMESC